ncbi:MAG: alpha/beta hydrolase fold domain-containing protein [Propionicimonas sp.]
MSDVDVAQLRADARERAAGRAPASFAGEIEDARLAGIPVRRYRPTAAAEGALVYLHGGYGLFGDLDLQDNYCRHLASGLRLEVVSVDYRLAPEASLAESVADALTAVGMLRAEGVHRLWLAGDSAGGAVACLAAQGTRKAVAGVLLTNPILDFSLSSFDERAPDGPDRELIEFALRSWCRVDDLANAPELRYRAAALPSCLIVVGARDALAPEARALAVACREAGVECRLVTLAGVGHGFVSAGRTEEVVAEAIAFFGLG